MPVYEYLCDRCGQRFELLRPVARMDERADCPQGHKGSKRVLSSFAAHTSGGDFYDEAPASGGCGGCAGGACACSAN